ncbi:MAG TPA: hypothetical protein VLA72_16970 [Anaerolineales bacterium]|nr:hypothetical protein [Anaerolineales bacterium]
MILSKKLKSDSLDGFRNFISKLEPFSILETKAGLILAEGNKDITEIDSQFHSRNEIPICEKQGYYSINTSKYTSAPMNTLLLENMIFNDCSNGFPNVIEK